MFFWLFLIGSFSYLQVRTYIKAYMSLNFRQIPPLTTELAALECLKNWCHHVISVDIDPVFFRLAGNKDMHNIMNELEFRPDQTTDYGVSCPWASKKYPIDLYWGKWCFHFFSVVFDWILLILSCNKNKHESLDEFEFFEMRFDLGILDSGERLLPFGLLVIFNIKTARTVLLVNRISFVICIQNKRVAGLILCFSL